MLEEWNEDGFSVSSDSTVYVTRYGYKHHYYEDCQALKNSNTVQAVTLQEAVEGHHSDVCSFCATRAAKEAGVDGAAEVQEALEAIQPAA